MESELENKKLIIPIEPSRKRLRTKLRQNMKKPMEEDSTDTDTSSVSSVKAKSTAMSVNSETDLTVFSMTARKRRITDDENPKFSHPGTSKKGIMPPPKPLETKNKFSVTVPIEKDMDTVPIENKEAEKIDPPKSKKPPPIIIHGKFTDHKKLNNFLKTKLRDTFYWKHTSQSTSLQLMNIPDWTTVNKYFEKVQLQYHTYTPKSEKSHAFVIKGLYHNLDINDIKEELEIDHKIPVKNIYTMKGTQNPLYMLVTSNEITLKELQNKIRYLDRTCITWERHLNNKRIIQCHRCQMWGHATSNCRAKPRCLKCAAEHLTTTCTKSRDVAAKCANCGEAHPANSITCKVYKRKIEDIERNNTRVPPQAQMKYIAAPASQMKYVAAPMPKNNAWETRQQTATQQQEQIASQDSVNFPPLLQKKTTESQISTPQISTTQAVGGLTAFDQLQHEYRRIAVLIDLDQMLKRVRLLANQLERCTSESEKFQVFYNFMLNIDNNAY